MSVELNHTIVHVSDKHAAAENLAEILGVGVPTSYGPFRVLTGHRGSAVGAMIVPHVELPAAEQETGDDGHQHQEVPDPVARSEGAPRRQGWGVRRHGVRLRAGRAAEDAPAPSPPAPASATLVDHTQHQVRREGAAR